MGKVILIAGAVLVVALLAFMLVKPSSGTGAVITSNAVNTLTLSEKEKYAKFEAEVACGLADVMKDADSEDAEFFITETVKVVEEISSKYGYTMSEVQDKKLEYEDDAEFQKLAMDYTLEICPEIMSDLSS